MSAACDLTVWPGDLLTGTGLSGSDGRFYMFASGSNWKRTRGVNLLFSTTQEDFFSAGCGNGSHCFDIVLTLFWDHFVP